jgi:hypothetical protein
MSRGKAFAQAWFGRGAFGPPPWAAGWQRGPGGPGHRGWNQGPGFGPGGFGPGAGFGFGPGFGPGFGFGHGEQEQDPQGHERGEFFAQAAQLGGAAMQVAQAGSDEQLIEAQQVLKEARRSLYRILAKEDPEDLAPPTTEA